MAEVLFIPLNTNHVRIFEPVCAGLKSSFAVVCHDLVSESDAYRTGRLLVAKDLHPVDFPARVERNPVGSLRERIREARQIGRGVAGILRAVRPRVAVLCIDHDPTAILFIREARRRGVRSVVMQEGLIRPRDLEAEGGWLHRLRADVTAACGLPTGYVRFGSRAADVYLLSGNRARDVLLRAGVPASRLVVVGQPKYDHFLRQAKTQQAPQNKTPVFLFAAPADLLKASWGPELVRMLADEARRRKLRIIVKLHPRGLLRPEEVLNCAGGAAGETFTVIKTDDDTIELLSRSDGLITISSTVVLEALIFGKECVVLDYLAGKTSLGYGASGAVHLVEEASKLGEHLGEAVSNPTSPDAKRRLLEDELHLLDGRAAERVAAFLEGR